MADNTIRFTNGIDVTDIDISNFGDAQIIYQDNELEQQTIIIYSIDDRPSWDNYLKERYGEDNVE